MEETTDYKTKDFYLAVTIKTLGYILKDLIPDENNPSFSYFVFENPNDEIKQVEMDWLNRKLLMEPRLFVETIKEFKRALSVNHN